MARNYYRIRKETAVQDLNAIGWKVRISNEEVAKNLFHKHCEINMFIASMLDGVPGSFHYPDAFYYSKSQEPPTTVELGEIR